MYIVFIVDSYDRYVFFRRLCRAGDEYLFFTTDPLIYFLCVSAGIPSYLCHPFLRARLTSGSNSEDLCASALEVVNSDISMDQAVKDFSLINYHLDSLFSQRRPDRVVIWNGQQLLGRVAHHVSLLHKLSMRFMEISNFEGKLLADSSGVNALSSVALNPQTLDCYEDVPDDVHLAWVGEYIESKRMPLPQAQISRARELLKVTSSYFKYLMKSIFRFPLNYRPKKKFSAAIYKGCTDSSFDYGNYILLPLQVSTDTQVKLHSDFDNISALCYAIEKSKNLNLNLVVKIHPAERSEDELIRIENLAKGEQFYVSTLPTIDLLMNCVEVITINSTVGFEAKILGKKVDVLGRAYYKNFDERRMRKYLHRYLVSGVDYFSKNPIDSVTVDKLLGV